MDWDYTSEPPSQGNEPDPQAAQMRLADLDGNAKLALGAAIAVVVGSFLPWVQATTILGTISINGSQGDGKITAAAGVVAVITAWIAANTGRQRMKPLGPASMSAHAQYRVLAALAMCVSLATGVYNYADINSIANEAADDGVLASAGSGLYLCIAGSVVGLIGLLRLRPSASESPSAPHG